MSHTAFGARIALLGLLAAALSACASAATPAADEGMPMQPMEITVAMTDFAFEPAEITARLGQPIALTLVNKGALLHDFTSTDAEVEVMSMDEGAEHDMGDMMDDAKMHIAVDVNHSEVLEFTPTKAGTYTFYCTVEGHKEAGMTGTLVVTP
jgi:uncharacterized cupredoxin-like copper-binding protein